MNRKNKTVIVDNLMLSYIMAGPTDKPVILYLHGWGDSKETFNNIINELGESYQHIALDLPGFGESQAPKETWGLSNFSLLIANFLQKLLVSPEIIIAHSNGGAIAIYGIAHTEISTTKLVLLASSGVRDTKRFKKQILKSIAKTAKVATKIVPNRLQTKLKEKAYSSIGSELHMVPGMEDTFKKVVSYDISTDASNVTVPTLLIYGEEDTATPVSHARQLTALMQHASLQIIPNAHHMIQREKPEQVIKYIKDFML